MNAAEPPTVLVNKLVEDGKDLRFSIEVHGVFLQRFECAKFPFDIQDLSVKAACCNPKPQTHPCFESRPSRNNPELPMRSCWGSRPRIAEAVKSGQPGPNSPLSPAPLTLNP